MRTIKGVMGVANRSAQKPGVSGSAAAGYEAFLRNNRIKINARMNRILWGCVLAGPAIAVGVAAGIFYGITLWDCLNISVMVAALSVAHQLLFRRRRDSLLTSLFALLVVDCLLVYMSYIGVSIYLTWFLMPLMSLMFCDVKIYRVSVAINYLFMLLSVWLVAPGYVAVRTDYTSAVKYFLTHSAGYTIEMLILLMVGNTLCRMTSGYYRDLIDNYKTLRAHERRIRRQVDLLDSMAEIYDNVNLLDLDEMTETPLRGEEFESYGIERGERTYTRMNRRLMESLVPEHLEAFRDFTDLNTLPGRLSGKKIISGEFVNRDAGWFRAQYIAVDSDAAGNPEKVVYTTQNIDAEKSREERLRYISLTDELTGLYNRRCYEEDVSAYDGCPPEEDFVIVSIDVNGLKPTNDSKGHAAGDELLRGTAECLTAVFGEAGKVYRTGGDEFIATLCTTECGALCERVRQAAAAWHGDYIATISLSLGWASRAEHPGATLHELEKLADAMMYEDKDRYYRSSGLDRRSRSSAYAALCGVCVKILKLDLREDSFTVLNSSEEEKGARRGLAGRYSDWARDFAASGGVAQSDVDEYLRRTDIEYLRKHLSESARPLTVSYLRRDGDGFRRAVLDVVRDADFGAEKQTAYLSVRLLDDPARQA